MSVARGTRMIHEGGQFVKFHAMQASSRAFATGFSDFEIILIVAQKPNVYVLTGGMKHQGTGKLGPKRIIATEC